MHGDMAILVVAAHPDDETIGAGGLLGLVPRATVVHVTTGAPREARLVPEPARGLSRCEYAELRRSEAVSALSLAGIPKERVLSLGGTDQEATKDLASLARSLAAVLTAQAPDMIIAHAYEGGHPDHDASAALARAALALVGDALDAMLVEMTSYHARGDAVVRGEFLRRGSPERVLELERGEQARKRAMLACYASQREVLAPFGVERERFRVASPCDFSRAPHDGRLHYEHLGWAMTGADWRGLATRGLAELGLPMCI